jgi:hypothetical protein
MKEDGMNAKENFRKRRGLHSASSCAFRMRRILKCMYFIQGIRRTRIAAASGWGGVGGGRKPKDGVRSAGAEGGDWQKVENGLKSGGGL